MPAPPMLPRPTSVGGHPTSVARHINKEFARTAYKPDFVPLRGMTIPLPLLLPTGSSCQPEPAGTKAIPRPAPHAVPIWRCSQWGLPCQNCYQPRGGLLLHRFTLTQTRMAGRSIFCGAFRRVAPPGRYPAPLLLGVRTFLATVARPAAIQPSAQMRSTR
jgi:hypothetical protein